MRELGYLEAFLRSPKTVFTATDAAMLWGQSSDVNTRSRLRNAVNSGKLLRLRKGLYAKDTNYNRFELAVKIYTPAYLSFETVLLKEGVIFQYSDEMHVASYLTREIECDGHTIVYRKLKEDILTNPLGIDQQGEIAIASKERALLDTLYLNKSYYFDNLEVIDWNKVFSLVGIYSNKRLLNELKRLHQSSRN